MGRSPQEPKEDQFRQIVSIFVVGDVVLLVVFLVVQLLLFNCCCSIVVVVVQLLLFNCCSIVVVQLVLFLVVVALAIGLCCCRWWWWWWWCSCCCYGCSCCGCYVVEVNVCTHNFIVFAERAILLHSSQLCYRCRCWLYLLLLFVSCWLAALWSSSGCLGFSKSIQKKKMKRRKKKYGNKEKAWGGVAGITPAPHTGWEKAISNINVAIGDPFFWLLWTDYAACCCCFVHAVFVDVLLMCWVMLLLHVV